MPSPGDSILGLCKRVWVNCVSVRLIERMVAMCCLLEAAKRAFREIAEQRIFCGSLYCTLFLPVILWRSVTGKCPTLLRLFANPIGSENINQ